MRTADFFAGVGGVRLGLEQAGFETIFSNDFDRFCKITYDLNSKLVKQTLEDIRNIKGSDIPDFDFLQVASHARLSQLPAIAMDSRIKKEEAIYSLRFSE